MPAVGSNQSSRSGLITAVIVSVTLAVVMIVLAVYYGQAASKAETALANRVAEDKALIFEGAASDKRISALTANKPEGLNSALEILLAQNEQLIRQVGAPSGGDASAVAKQSVADASKAIGDLSSQKLINLSLAPNTSLTAAIQSLTTYIGTLAAEKKAADDQLATERKSKADQIAADNAVLADKDKQIAAANDKATAAEAKVAEQATAVGVSLAAVTQTGTDKLKESQDAVTQLTNQLQALNKKSSANDTLIASLKNKLHESRVNPNNAVVQQVDGNILRVADNTVYISIGSHQSVTKGLTFEVYDKNKGIPPLGNGTAETNMPIGKASIEVFDVGPDSSACRIIKLGTGEHVVVGDLIANLVFDPNAKYNFVVYGNFDLTGAGNPSASDTEVVKRLISQWGGKLQDHVDVNTDFVIMGIPPEVPPITDPGSAPEVARNQEAKLREAKYQAQISQADSLNVPIMNQNRFLYFIGYFDQAKR